MKLVGKVPVEPLDDERLTNIERNLVVHVSEMSQRPVHASSRMLLAFAGMALAVAVAAFVGWKLRGDGAVVPRSEPEQLVMKDGALHLPDADITGKDFTVSRSTNRVVVKMEKAGKLDLRVDHKPGRLFVVHAGDVEIEDIGTAFSVDWDGTNVDVRVTEGEVKVKHAGKAESIIAGNAWTIEFGKLTIVQLEEKLATHVAAVDAAGQQAVVVAQGPTTNDATNAGSNNAGNGSNAQGSNGGSAHGSGQGSGVKRAGGPNAKKALEKFPLDPLVATDEKDPKQAINKYLEQAQTLPEGEAKADLLQSIAVMHLRAKNFDGAKRAIEGVLHKRQGPGPWRDWPAYKSALWLDVRIKCLVSHARTKTFDDTCRLAANKYIATYPTGPASGVVQQVLDEI